MPTGNRKIIHVKSVSILYDKTYLYKPKTESLVFFVFSGDEVKKYTSQGLCFLILVVRQVLKIKTGFQGF